MSLRPLVALGTTNNLVAKLVAAINRSAPTWEFLGFVDDDPSRHDRNLRYGPVLGGTEVLEALAADRELWAFNNVNLTPELSRRADRILDDAGCRRTSLIHPAIDLTFATHGENCGLFEGTLVGPRVVLGRHVTARMGCTISHGVTVGDYVYLSPNVTLCGDVVLGDGVDVGASATILPSLTVGADTFIGAGSVVTKALPANAVAMGYPARVVKSERD